MKNKQRKVIIAVFLFVFLSTSFIYFIPQNTNNVITTFFTLDALVSSSNTKAISYMELIKQHLLHLGINLNINIVDDNDFSDTLCFHHDFDLAYLEINEISITDMINHYYHENGSRNLFGYDISMDYSESLGTGKNQWYINQLNTLIPADSQDRIELLWEWQYYLMDEILPCIPLFGNPEYIAYWYNLNGYNFSSEMRKSWGHMFWDGLHLGQESTSEIVIADSEWTELNPFFHSDEASQRIIDCTLDKLIEFESSFKSWPHLAQNWIWIDNHTLDIKIRDGIKWPDYGTFTNESLDVDDIYFSLYCWKEISVRFHELLWLSDFEKLDDMTIRLHIDGNPSTIEPDPYAAVMEKLALWIVPEHYMNQTQEADGVTPDITHHSWTDYSINVWGTNIFEIDDYVEDKETILKIKSNSWHFNTSIISDPLLDYERRYGNYAGGLTTLKIKNIQEYNEIMDKFESGKIDLAIIDSNFLYQFLNMYDSFFNIQSKKSLALSMIALNIRNERGYLGSNDPVPGIQKISIGLALRKAIAYVINKHEINQIIHNNKLVDFYHPILPSFDKLLHPNIIRYCHNVDVARYFMTISGFGFTDREIPYWEDVCDPDYEYDKTIGIDGLTYLLAIAVLVSIGMFSLIKNRKLIEKRRKK